MSELLECVLFLEDAFDYSGEGKFSLCVSFINKELEGKGESDTLIFADLVGVLFGNQRL